MNATWTRKQYKWNKYMISPLNIIEINLNKQNEYDNDNKNNKYTDVN
jgi:hypothetical protein